MISPKSILKASILAGAILLIGWASICAIVYKVTQILYANI